MNKFLSALGLVFILSVGTGSYYYFIKPRQDRMHQAQWKLEREKSHINQPATAETLFKDANMYIEYGDPDRARMLLRRLQQDFPDSKEAIKADAVLESLQK